MSATTVVGKLLLLTAVALTSACSSTHPPTNQEELQQAALSRWNGCIERHQVLQDTAVIDLLKEANTRCEGHQRDVIATFPAHLENQVDSLLSQRSNNMAKEQFLRSGILATWNLGKNTQVDMLKQRSSGPQSDDL